MYSWGIRLYFTLAKLHKKSLTTEEQIPDDTNCFFKSVGLLTVLLTLTYVVQDQR